MQPAPTPKTALDLAQRIGATAIANQAILKCILSGVPVTTDNVIFFVGDFVDPEDEAHAPMIAQIEEAIAEVVETAKAIKGARRH